MIRYKLPKRLRMSKKYKIVISQYWEKIKLRGQLAFMFVINSWTRLQVPKATLYFSSYAKYCKIYFF